MSTVRTGGLHRAPGEPVSPRAAVNTVLFLSWVVAFPCAEGQLRQLRGEPLRSCNARSCNVGAVEPCAGHADEGT